MIYRRYFCPELLGDRTNNGSLLLHVHTRPLVSLTPSAAHPALSRVMLPAEAGRETIERQEDHQAFSLIHQLIVGRAYTTVGASKQRVGSCGRPSFAID